MLELIETSLREAWEGQVGTVTFVHGHGMNRSDRRPLFMNSNTGELGLCVRSHLRNSSDLRKYMLAKIDVSDIGATTVRIRRKAGNGHFWPKDAGRWKAAMTENWQSTRPRMLSSVSYSVALSNR